MTKSELREIFDKTTGHCHFCGDPLVFENRGWSPEWDGHWEVDHVVQRQKGGPNGSENCLAACTPCNRLRWQRTGGKLRELLVLGLIAVEQVNARTAMGQGLVAMRGQRARENEKRRKGAKRPAIR